MGGDLRVIGITDGRNVPSARFRVAQLLAPLARRGVAVDWRPAPVPKYAPAQRWMRPFWFPAAVAGRLPAVLASRGADVTWLGRELVATVATLEPWLRRPLVLDVDDAIWIPRGGGGIRRLVRHVDHVFAGNGYVADWFRRAGCSVEVIPTAVDVERFRPAERPAAADGSVVIGWTGTSSNHAALADVSGALGRVLADRPRARLLIVSDRRPRLPDLPADRVEFVRWDPGNEVATLQAMDVGIMPLFDTEWARGKCSYKMLLSMACGLPVVVAPVGMNADVLAAAPVGFGAGSPAEWRDRLIELVDDAELRGRLGREGRRVVVADYGTEAVADAVARGLKRAAGR